MPSKGMEKRKKEHNENDMDTELKTGKDKAWRLDSIKDEGVYFEQAGIRDFF